MLGIHGIIKILGVANIVANTWCATTNIINFIFHTYAEGVASRT